MSNQTLLRTSIIQRGVLALILAGSPVGAAGVTTTGSVGAAPRRVRTCKQVRASMDTYPVNSWQFRYLSMKDCTGNWY